MIEIICSHVLEYAAYTSLHQSWAVISPLQRVHSFIKSALEQLEKWKFHGLDVDWEFPNKYNKHKEDKPHFQTFLQELYDQLHPKNMTLTIAIPGWSSYIENGFDARMVANISKLISFANLMSYDYNVFNNRSRPFTGPNSPLNETSTFKNPYSREETRYLIWSARNWSKALNLTKEKIVVGISFFGRRFRLRNVGKHRFHAPAVPLETEDQVRKKVRVDAKVSYNWTCHFLMRPGTQKRWDNVSHTPYAFNRHTWVSYDDEHSVADKVKWILKHGYGGVMTYTLNDDDMNGDCDKANKSAAASPASPPKKFPLQRTVYDLTKSASVCTS
ncbi:acidic mammalian chitinase-like isoform X2 [Ornithodoros turicata]|uniref:acidic mammalian chitinase-like isoform X2 n=1 Tax=Ornithodoros turicata TaxID=34597 RepID=UPI003139CDE5